VLWPAREAGCADRRRREWYRRDARRPRRRRRRAEPASSRSPPRSTMPSARALWRRSPIDDSSPVGRNPRSA